MSEIICTCTQQLGILLAFSCCACVCCSSPPTVVPDCTTAMPRAPNQRHLRHLRQRRHSKEDKRSMTKNEQDLSHLICQIVGRRPHLARPIVDLLETPKSELFDPSSVKNFLDMATAGEVLGALAFSVDFA